MFYVYDYPLIYRFTSTMPVADTVLEFERESRESRTKAIEIGKSNGANNGLDI